MFNLVKSFTDLTRPSTAILCKIFLSALAIRWAYALLLYAFLGDDGLKYDDGFSYAENAQTFAEAIRAGTVQGSQWLSNATQIMPIYQWFAMLPFFIFGKYGAIGYVLIQSVFDSGTCIIVYRLAASLDRRLALPAAIIAILNPTQIVLSGLIYTDTLYTFFVALSFLCALYWTKAPTWRHAIFLGSALACASLTRVSIAPWAFCAIGLLGLYSAWLRISFRQIMTLTASIMIFLLGLGIILTRNFQQQNAFALTPQTGEHLAHWIVPLAKEAQDRTSFFITFDDMTARTTERFGPPSPNPFVQSLRYQEIGREALRNEIKLTSLVKAWASGIFINLVSPAHLLSPPVINQPRTGFYATHGVSFADKIFNYAFHSSNTIYGQLLIIGSLGMGITIVIQLYGLWTLIQHRSYWPKIIFAISWIGFLLLLSGPVASPKYRLPLEPLFNIAAGAGIVSIYDWRNRKSAKRNETLARA